MVVIRRVEVFLGADKSIASATNFLNRLDQRCHACCPEVILEPYEAVRQKDETLFVRALSNVLAQRLSVSLDRLLQKCSEEVKCRIGESLDVNC
ncbi:DciA family protein [Brevibacterium mcbrellneri]|uniref:DciA family protein n=1 Tax=Brevibacterium mcbrellneri TaxID=53363 RepID=UPI000A003FAB